MKRGRVEVSMVQKDLPLEIVCKKVMKKVITLEFSLFQLFDCILLIYSITVWANLFLHKALFAC